ncbi:MAG TPA: bifunctional DNA primase/polymerase [Acidimicrobiales bacterium]|nr:bifunctional DNA primase/polymerase [Acidimicrobiales bacterium]
MSEITMRDAAIKFANRGHPVIPLHSIDQRGRCTCGRACDSPAKHPRTPNGLKSASADPAVVARWWRRWRTANIGLLTGESAGLFVLDVDGPEGLESLARLEAHHGSLPATRWVRTGSGGRHAYFGWPGGVDLGNTCRKLGAGLDTRATNGYVVTVPSVHVTGRSYEWMNHERAAQMPTWLIDLLSPPARTPVAAAAAIRLGRPRGDYGRAALAGEEAKVRMAPVGVRNHSLNVAAYSLGQLVAGGVLNLHEVAGTLLAAGLAAGLGELEAMRTIESGLSAGQQSPRGRTA